MAVFIFYELFNFFGLRFGAWCGKCIDGAFYVSIIGAIDGWWTVEDCLDEDEEDRNDHSRYPAYAQSLVIERDGARGNAPLVRLGGLSYDGAIIETSL